MSDFLFRIPKDWELSPYQLNSIYVIGLDGIPWPCKSMIVADRAAGTGEQILQITRNQDESGRIYFSYPSESFGEILLPTGMMPTTDAVYDLLKELARGTLNRLRNQLSIWQEGGLSIPETTTSLVDQATTRLRESVLSQAYDDQDIAASQSLELTLAGIFELSEQFGHELSAMRREHQSIGGCWTAVNIGMRSPASTVPDNELFDLVECQANQGRWGELEESKNSIILGPWLSAGAGCLDDELLSQRKFQSRRAMLLRRCREELENIPEDISLLHVASGLNGIGHQDLSYPQQLQLTSDLLNLVTDSMVESPTMISFDFPWAERLASVAGGVHPLQIADSLLRQGLDISFLGLEINLDYWPNGSAIRDPLQWIDLVDIWAQLELPLVLCLRAPSGSQASLEQTADRLTNQPVSCTTDSQRLRVLKIVLKMMAARPSVQGIIWSQWQDQDDPRFPGAGVVDSNGKLRPIRAAIEELDRSLVG